MTSIGVGLCFGQGWGAAAAIFVIRCAGSGAGEIGDLRGACCPKMPRSHRYLGAGAGGAVGVLFNYREVGDDCCSGVAVGPDESSVGELR